MDQGWTCVGVVEVERVANAAGSSGRAAGCSLSGLREGFVMFNVLHEAQKRVASSSCVMRILSALREH